MAQSAQATQRKQLSPFFPLDLSKKEEREGRKEGRTEGSKGRTEGRKGQGEGKEALRHKVETVRAARGNFAGAVPGGFLI